MSKYIRIQTSFMARAALLALVLLWATVASAQSVTLAVVQVDDSVTPAMAEFVDLGPDGKCKSKAQGEHGCLKMDAGDSGPLNFFFQGSPGWRYEWIEIREPFANWGDPVPASILGEFKDMSGGSDFFDANGRKEFSTPVRFFNINDLNSPGNGFVVQYRVSVTNGTDHVIIHPIIENRG